MCFTRQSVTVLHVHRFHNVSHEFELIQNDTAQSLTLSDSGHVQGPTLSPHPPPGRCTWRPNTPRAQTGAPSTHAARW